VSVLSDAEIAGMMNWKGPGAYTAGAMRKVKAIAEEAARREREAFQQVQPQPAVGQNTGSVASVSSSGAATPAEGHAVANQPGVAFVPRWGNEDIDWIMKLREREAMEYCRFIMRCWHQVNKPAEVKP
jgi:hypothetical protein